ncbi:MAG: DUF4261 domain-containing protein [Clostridium sp.]|nr:DUF4261 domain-containing protein [Acetatifactor muris]MCM1527488.1 DUF4261 domain-containing protein [Bacteroides sp.]MCM1562068.1 DUF4261 domain-containing protein [Clostridium sp.]
MAEKDLEKIKAASKRLEEWLSAPGGPGIRAAKLEYVESFQAEDGTECMIFKFRKSVFSKWMLGIVNDLGAFSGMREFRQEYAVRDAEECLETLRAGAGSEPGRAESPDGEYAKDRGVFSGFVLLSDKSWDKEKFKRDFLEDWGLSPEYDEGEEGADREDADREREFDAMLFEMGSQRVALGFMGMPVPNGEAEHNAAFNYTWKEAVEVTKTHKAQITVAILGAHEDVKKDGELFVKVTATLCRQTNAIAVYANGVVYQPQFYFAMKEFMEQGLYPLPGLLWLGIMRSEGGFHVYTIGMNSFGKPDMEILDVAKDPNEARDFLMNVALYCIDGDVTLKDGETVGLTARQKCKVIRSPGVCMGGTTLKIAYER